MTRNDYLSTQVLTASPQRLHLILIEAALRYGNQAREHWHAADSGTSTAALIRAQKFVSEMIGGLSPRENPVLVRQINEIYLFIYRSLVEANLTRSEAKLAGALRVLEIERETWRLASLQASAAHAALASPDDSPMTFGQSFVA